MTDYELHCMGTEMADDYLDSAYDSVVICGMTFYPSYILAKCDPTAYDMLRQELIDEYIESTIDVPEDDEYEEYDD